MACWHICQYWSFWRWYWLNTVFLLLWNVVNAQPLGVALQKISRPPKKVEIIWVPKENFLKMAPRQSDLVWLWKVSLHFHYGSKEFGSVWWQSNSWRKILSCHCCSTWPVAHHMTWVLHWGGLAVRLCSPVRPAAARDQGVPTSSGLRSRGGTTATKTTSGWAQNALKIPPESKYNQN